MRALLAALVVLCGLPALAGEVPVHVNGVCRARLPDGREVGPGRWLVEAGSKVWLRDFQSDSWEAAVVRQEDHCDVTPVDWGKSRRCKMTCQ